MPVTKPANRTRLPGRFDRLVRLMPPQAISDEGAHERALEMIDRLMAGGRLTRGQSLYLETLVQLVQAYEAAQHHIDASALTGVDSLKHLMDQNHMSASDLSRVLGVHASLGSKILKGERSLTIDHIKRLAEIFKFSPTLFID